MTVAKETRHVFDLCDIRAIRLHCNQCGREAVQPIKQTEVPKKCPLCHEDWEVDYPAGNRGHNWQMIHAMQGLVKADSPRMTIRFEIDAESG